MTTKPIKGNRAQPTTDSIQGCIDNAYSEVEALREEIVEWRDNLEGAEMDHMPKYDEVSEAAEYMECVMESMEGLNELATHITGHTAEYKVGDWWDIATVAFTQDTRKRSTSRGSRLDNAMRIAEALYEYLHGSLHLIGNDDVKDDLESALDEWNSATCEAQSVCFPGMF